MTLYDVMLATSIQASKLSLAERGYAHLRKYERERIAAALGVPVGDIDFDRVFAPRRGLGLEGATNV
jgi:hypothetical protein